jgi:hypothetical protein
VCPPGLDFVSAERCAVVHDSISALSKTEDAAIDSEGKHALVETGFGDFISIEWLDAVSSCDSEWESAASTIGEEWVTDSADPKFEQRNDSEADRNGALIYVEEAKSVDYSGSQYDPEAEQQTGSERCAAGLTKAGPAHCCVCTRERVTAHRVRRRRGRGSITHQAAGGTSPGEAAAPASLGAASGEKDIYDLRGDARDEEEDSKPASVMEGEPAIDKKRKAREPAGRVNQATEEPYVANSDVDESGKSSDDVPEGVNEAVRHMVCGNAAVKAKDLEGAMAHYNTALCSIGDRLHPAATEKVPSETPGGLEVTVTLLLKIALVEIEAAVCAEVAGDTSKAEELYHSAARRTQKVKELDPQNVKANRHMALAEEGLGMLGEVMQNPKEQTATGRQSHATTQTPAPK